MLSKHINPDRLIRESKDSDSTSHPYGARYGIASIPKFHIPSKGASAETTYQLIHDELSLDGSTSLNLASFVQTWMPEPANKLMMENISKNLIDQDEYPMTQEIHTRCVSILADLWHAPSAHAGNWDCHYRFIGSYTAGWSRHEATLARAVESKYRLDPKKAMEYVDENTIGVYLKEMSDLLDEYQQKTGINVPIHVDGASGAFVAPFAHPKLLWDFKLPRVVSINTSGHKFGLAYVGVGWVVWRSKEYLPKDLIFELHYLGSVEYSFSLNFSRPAAPIIAQYFNFIHLGFEGYRAVAKDDLENARLLSRALEKSGWYTVLSDIHRPKVKDILQKNAHNDFDEENIENYEEGLPVVAFRFSDSFQGSYPDIQQKWIQILLRAKGWIVPNYELAPDLEQVQILRVVVKENMTESLVDRLLEDIVEVTQDLIKQESPTNALNLLGNHSRKNRDNGGKMDEGSASGYSGTYSKPC
ncbi:pyridoxal phosphate-dependent transferase [Suillus subluteus]|nr:pyridoxal phosphate-dependent transferase [Suillus subluteus]